MSNVNEMQNERITEIDGRLRSVEGAVIELATLGRYVKILVILLAATAGIDISGLMV
jgi:hypothetical protein